MRRLAAAIALVAATAAGRVHADPSPEQMARAKTYFEDANKHYELREYAKAIELFKQAYELLPDPEFQFDIAQSYRQANDCANSSAFYRNYLRNKPDADNRGRVEKFISEMDACAKQQQDERDAEAERQRKALEAQRPIERKRKDNSTMLIAGLATIGGGLIATGFGVYFSVDAANQQNKLQQLCAIGCDGMDVAPFDRSGKTDNMNATITYAIGGTAIAAGVGMLLWATLHVEYETLTVTPAPGGATVGARLRF
jgi:tetratricopeptide (TPR) repeat protein